MGSLPRLRLLEPPVDQDTVSVLEDLLEEAKRGDLTGIAFIAMQHGAEYKGDVTGRCRLLPILAIGLLRALEKQVTDLL